MNRATANASRERLANTTLLGAALHFIVSILATVAVVFGAFAVLVAGGWHVSEEEADRLGQLALALVVGGVVLLLAAIICGVLMLRRYAWARGGVLAILFTIIALAIPLAAFEPTLPIFVLFSVASASTIACVLNPRTSADFKRAT